MPGSDGFFGSALHSALSSGSVSAATLRSMASGILTQMFAFGLFDNPPAGSPAATATSAAHVADALQLAEEGTVLLKKCLDDTGFSTTPGTQVQIWSCTGAANQAWTLP